MHKNYIWLAAAVAVGLLVGAAMLLAVSRADNATLDENASARAALKQTVLTPVEKPDIAGFSLSILTDAVGAPFFDTEETDATARAARIDARNAHLTQETGAAVTVHAVADFVKTAQADILSGSYQSNLYIADAAGSLSKLLSAACLRDTADDPYLHADAPWFGEKLTDTLRIGGKRFLLSSAAVDARFGAVAVVYNRALAAGVERAGDDGRTLAAVALDGDFTLEYLLTLLRAANADADLTAAALDADNTEAGLDLPLLPRGFYAEADDLFSLFFGLGGSFLVPGTEETVPYETFADALDQTLTLYAEIDSGADAAFRAGGAIFTLASLSELNTLGNAADFGILPLPKRTADADYRSYVDLRGTAMVAIPADVPDADKVSYLFERMSYLSYGYIEPILCEPITDGDSETACVLALILDSAEGTLTELFGYGDIPGLLASVAERGTSRLEMEFCKRKTLCEKALSIVEKRLVPHDADASDAE